MTGRAATLAVVLALVLAGCRGRSGAAGGAVAIVDDAGDTVRLAAPARHIASLIPTTTEILVAAGLAARVAARTDWCDWPPEARRIPSVGGGFPPNLEAVLDRRPDLVLLYRSGANAAAAARLAHLGVPVAQLRTDRIADVPRTARLLGRLTGAADALERVAVAFERDLRAAASPGRDDSRPPSPAVLVLAWSDPAVVLGATAFMSELLELAGGRNVFADVAGASAPVSLEAIVARDPAAVFLADASAGPVLARPEWQAIPAVRAGRIFTPLEPALTRAGLRAPAGVRRLRRQLLHLAPVRPGALTPSPLKDSP